MTTTLGATYENGKLVLSEPLPLAENARVRVTIETDAGADENIDRAAWLRLSEQSLIKTWDNADDDAFNELLSK